MAIKDLRMMRRGVDVTVVVGKTKYGSDVTCKVSFSRADLAEVLAPLEALALEQATAILSTSVTQQDVDARVADELMKKVAPAKERYRKNAINAVESLVKDIETQLVMEERIIGKPGEDGKAPSIETLPGWRIAAIKRRLDSAREVVANLKAAS